MCLPGHVPKPSLYYVWKEEPRAIHSLLCACATHAKSTHVVHVYLCSQLTLYTCKCINVTLITLSYLPLGKYYVASLGSLVGSAAHRQSMLQCNFGECCVWPPIGTRGCCVRELARWAPQHPSTTGAEGWDPPPRVPVGHRASAGQGVCSATTVHCS